jgi:hypothetical protein
MIGLRLVPRQLTGANASYLQGRVSSVKRSAHAAKANEAWNIRTCNFLGDLDVVHGTCLTDGSVSLSN